MTTQTEAIRHANREVKAGFLKSFHIASDGAIIAETSQGFHTIWEPQRDTAWDYETPDHNPEGSDLIL